MACHNLTQRFVLTRYFILQMPKTSLTHAKDAIYDKTYYAT